MDEQPALVPGDDQILQLNKLSDIYDHMRDIAVKIANMAGDPLPQQLQQSMPGYLQTLCSHTDMLKKQQWTFIVAGDSAQTKADLLSALLADHSLSSPLHRLFTHCPSQPVSVSHSHTQFFHVILEQGRGAASEPLVLENWAALDACVSQMRGVKTGISGDTVVEKVQLYLPCPGLPANVELLVYPETTRDQREPPRSLLEELTVSHGLIYGLNLDNPASMQKLQQFVDGLRRVRQSGRPPVVLMDTSMVVCFSAQQNFTRNNVMEQLPILDESCLVFLPLSPAADDTAPHTTQLTPCMAKILSCNLKNKVQFCYGWMQSFVSRVLHHLRAFLNQAEKSHEERRKTHSEILEQLHALTMEAEEFLKVLTVEVDGKVEEASVLLKQHLLKEETLQRLSCWVEEETPTEDVWVDLDNAIRLKITNRLWGELAAWEGRYKFFDQLRPQIIEIYEDRFHGIKSEISVVETMIAKHDSRLGLSELSRSVDSGETFVLSSLAYLPNTINLKWRTKLLLGLAAPILLPIALTALLLGIPVIGGLAAKDYLADKLVENKLKEYKSNSTKYMQGRTREEVRRFCKSRDLVDYIKGELRPAYRCIAQLQEDIPLQIKADRVQIESLRDDERDSKDLQRFYRPLVEVFEHTRLMLQLYKVLHIFREKTDIAFSDITVPENASVICDGLSGTIQPAYWSKEERVGSGNKRLVALKLITHKPETHNVEEYLQEEEAWRFQASPYIMKFLGVTKFSSSLYHVMEPLKCSLRQHITRWVQDGDSDRAHFLHGLLMGVVRGLDYLHDRGWVHFDLSLDTIGLNLQNQPKLTNISCPKLFNVPRNISQSALLRYTHLPPEVLRSPPAAYTSGLEMYSLGVVMWEMWTSSHLYWSEINTSGVIRSVDDFVAYTDTHRPPLIELHAANERVTSSESQSWARHMQRCWVESERISSKALLQLLEEEEGVRHMVMKEQHF